MSSLIAARLPAAVSPASLPKRASPLASLGRKGLALGFGLSNLFARLAYRLGTPGCLRLGGVDHLTLPCRDLAEAEDFYVGLLGARVLMRLTAEDLHCYGRPDAEIPHAVHLSLVFAGGPRVDLFRADLGQPPRDAGHPHVALSVPPDRLLGWKVRLEEHGVPTFGPTQLGPPGQASLYFNDPSGNHLELATMGYTREIPVGPPEMSRLAYSWSGR